MTMTRASSEAVSNESRGADAVRYDDGDIPREVGRASKEELGKWLESRRLPTQKMALEVNLAEGRGLVATEEITRGEAVLGVNLCTRSSHSRRMRSNGGGSDPEGAVA